MTLNAQNFKRSSKWFKDSEQRFVLFRGVNFASRTKLPPYLPTLPLEIKKLDRQGIIKFHEEMTNLHSEFDKMKDLGINVVRLLVMWKAIEPEPSSNPEILSDEGHVYLKLVKEIIDEFYSREIFVIIDFHQDLAHETFDGDGFPDWTLGSEIQLKDNSSPPSNEHWQFHYASLQVRDIMKNFWEDSKITYKDSQYSLQEHLSKTIGATAHFFQSINNGNGHPGILGYELFNEPISLDIDFVDFEKKDLFNFYERTRQEIRKTTNENEGDHSSFLFMEPRASLSPQIIAEFDFGFFESLINLEWKLDLSLHNDERVVFSFHYYDFMLFINPQVVFTERRKQKYQRILQNLKDKAHECGGIPFLTEFGADNEWTNSLILEPTKYSSVNRAVMDLQYQAIENNLLNSVYWNYDLYSTQEGHDNWNLENFSLLGPNREERNLDIISRPYPMYSSSEPTYLKFNINSKNCIMKFKGSPVDADTIIFVPKSRHYANGFEIHATSKTVSWDKNNQRLVWKQNKDHNEHMLIICPPNNIDEEIQTDEPSELINKLQKTIFVDD